MTITNNSLTKAVNKWEISAEESCSDHNFLKYNISIADSFNDVHNYQGTRYIEKEEIYQEFEQKLVQEALKIFNNTNFKGGTDDLDKNLSKTVLKENDLEKFVDTFTEALETARRKTFKTLSAENKIKMKKSVPWWTDNLTTMRKKTNALRRLYQITRNNEELRESRKQKYFETKKSINSKLETINSTLGRNTAM